jgi:hypothetical protein
MKGDSGGPAFILDGVQAYLFGVCNWGLQNPSFEFFASISAHLDWISQAADR